jgi:5-oxoprolinase (ATP-hydrolysing)
VRCPSALYETVVEVDECVTVPLGEEPTARNGGARAALLAARHPPPRNSRLASGPQTTTGETVCVRKPPDLRLLERDLQRVRDSGIKALAVVLKHSAVFPEHELAVGALARKMGFGQISLSHAVMPMVRMVPRGFTAAADAYLTPHIRRYIDAFVKGFDEGVEKGDVRLLFMQSDGGLAPARQFSGHRAVLSGPAGGYVGYARTTRWSGAFKHCALARAAQRAAQRRLAGNGGGSLSALEAAADAAAGADANATGNDPDAPPQVVGFDMGGTSTDVSRCAGGTLEHVFESTTAGVVIQAPQLDISTVAAGGGSRLAYRGGLFAVGPESAGAHPGPVCYRKPGGLLAVTDANVALGRVLPEFFPKIFGPGEDEPLDAEGARAAFEALAREVGADDAEAAASASAPPARTADDVAMGFVTVANEAMCRPIRALTQMRGHDASAHVLASFGGAGAQHACAVARSLGMASVFVHRYASVLSAVGIHLADVVAEAQAPAAERLGKVGEAAAATGAAPPSPPSSPPSPLTTLSARLDALQAEAVAKLQAQGFTAAGQVIVERFLNLRYAGTDVAVMTKWGAARDPLAVGSAEGGGGGGGGGANPENDDGDPTAAFEAAYRREFGFALDREVLVDDCRVRACGRAAPLPPVLPTPPASAAPPLPAEASPGHRAFFADPRKPGKGARLPTAVYRLDDLSPGHRVQGPAILLDALSTVVVEPGWEAAVTGDGNLLIDALSAAAAAERAAALFGRSDDEGNAAAAAEKTTATTAPPPPASSPAVATAPPLVPRDPVQLAVFAHRFMGIAEQMGRTLQRTSVSVNVKERLDFSCALFGPDGGLVANAPHLPVHLGAMSEAVRYQVRHYSQGGAGEGDPLVPGDVLVSNHPQLAGGSHLPDITVITPVFKFGGGDGEEEEEKGGSKAKREKTAAASGDGDADKNAAEQNEIIFFVASRGHHADIGGISPGSMPPASTRLSQEGAAIVSFKLVRAGAFQEEGIARLLTTPPPTTDDGEDDDDDGGGTGNANPSAPARPKAVGTRCLADNLSDLRAQVAANTRGIQLVRELVKEYGLTVVLSYMLHVRDSAEQSVRAMLRNFSLARGLPEVGTVSAKDQMDDGTPICLKITVDRRDGSATFDFEGTGAEVRGNANAPPAVTASAVIYALRCLVANDDVPLNQGCLAPITLKIPRGSVLNPSPGAAVVGGNVLTSQRVTDVVLRAFRAAAASQGCMNNLTFGDALFGYYETVAGGSGAGPGWEGRSGVHTHMTNTRITDPEVLERRYPVALRRFALRRGSGGQGRWRGGEGVEREIEFLRPLDVGILSERRAVAPFGILGGEPGAKGVNLLIRKGKEEGGEAGEGQGGASTVSLGGRAAVRVGAGDRLLLLTPGAGGYGPAAPDGADGEEAPEDEAALEARMTRAQLLAEAEHEAERRRRFLAGGGGATAAPAPAKVERRGGVAEYQRRQETA